MSMEIRLRRGLAAQWTSANTVLGPGEAGYETDTRKLKIGDGSTAWNSLPYFIGNLPGGSLNDLGDVTITDAANGDFLRWNGTAWVNDAVNLGTDTIGNYVVDIASGTGVTVSHTPGEASTASISIGQAVGTSSSVTFAAVTAPLIGNADTASQLATSRVIALSGDVTGSVSFNGSSSVDIATTIQPNSVALGTDTTGNYVNNVVSGTGVTVTHTPGEGSSASIAIGQDVSTSSSVTFAAVTAPLVGNANTASTLQNARTISLSGDVSGSVSFNGGSDVDISAIIQPNSVALGTDTTGNFMTDVAAGTGVTITHTPGEGSTASIAIGQSVATNASVQFANVDTTGNVTVGGNLTVNGTTTTLNTETLAVEDNIIVLNSNVTGAPSTNAGIEVERGDSTNVVLRWNESTDSWEVTEDGSSYKNIVTGDYIGRLNVGTGITRNLDGSTPTSGTEGPWYQISIGQDVATNASVQFAAVTASTFTGALVGNADTASSLQNARTIALSGDVSGSISFDGSASVNITTQIQPNSVALGTDTTGNYMTDVVAGTGIAITHTPGEGSSASVALNAGLNELSDVVIVGAPEKYQTLGYDGAGWVNSYAPVVSYVRNAEATTLTAGTVVYLFGGNGDHATVKRADNSSDATSSKTVGLINGSIAANENGAVVTRGYVSGMDLSAYSVGDVLWLGTNGGFTTTKPSAPQHLVYVGVVVRATNNGIIYVATQNGYEIEELHDVKITSPQNNDFLKYNSASAIWVNDPINLGTDTTGNYMTDVVAGTNISVTHTPGEGSSASIAVVGNPTFSGTASAADFRSEVFLVQPNGYVGWLSPADAFGRVYWSPTTARNIYLPDVSGSIITTGDTGTVTSTMIANGTIDGDDISETAGIGLLKLQYGSSGEMIVAAADGTPTWRAITGDISVNASGVVTIAADAVALGTNTTGNYVSDVVSTDDSITISHTPGEGSSASIALASTIDVTRVRFNPYTSNGQIVMEGANTKVGIVKWDPTTNQIINIPDVASPLGEKTFAITSSSTGVLALGTDTTGNYVVDLAGGTGVTISHTPGEGSTASVSIGQAVGTSSSVTFAHVTASAVSILATPTNSTDAATKQYVDQIAAGIDWHESVVLATTAALPNTPTYDNGSSGSGATLTAGENARLVIDGSNAVTGTRVLIKNQATATQNGVYVVTEQGSVSVAWVLTRAEDFDGDTSHEIYGGEAVFVTGGTNNIRQGFTVTSAGSGTAGAHEFGTDNLTFTQFTGTAAFTAGSGLSQSGNSIDIGTASSTRIVINADNIDLATVAQTNTTGTAGTSFVQSHTVDSYGRITGTVTSDVQDASTSAKGIARFNSGQFSVSSGSVSIANDAIALGTNTTGDYVASLVAGTGVTLTNNSGENASPTIAIGQAVATASSVTFAAVTAPLVGNADTASQLITARTISLTGDITGSVSFSGSADASISTTITANSVALGTDTTGNYLVNVVAQPGLVVTHTPGEGSTASIGLDSVIASSNAGSSGTNFLSAITVDGYGRVTAYTASDVQDASTSAKGIARFNSSHFSVSSGSVSLSMSACPYFSGLDINGQARITSASITTASISSASLITASVSGTLTAASTTVRVKYDTNKSIIALNADTSNSSPDVFQLISNYDIGTTGHTGHLLMKDSTNTSTRSGMVFRQSSSVAGIDVGPRLLVTSGGANDPLMSLDQPTAASAVFFVHRHTTGSVGVVLKEFGSSSTNMLEVRDSDSNSFLTIGGSSSSFQLWATSASFASGSISAATFGGAQVFTNLTVGGNLTVNGTTTTVNSTTITVDDPIITLGGDTAPSSDDNKDRGIEFRYHSGTSASVGFMGYDDSTGMFTFLTGATNTSEVFSGTAASVAVGSLVISSFAGAGVTLHDLLSTPTVETKYSTNIYGTLETSMGGPKLKLKYNFSEGVIGIENNSDSRFTFSRPIVSASLTSASLTSASLISPIWSSGTAASAQIGRVYRDGVNNASILELTDPNTVYGSSGSTSFRINTGIGATYLESRFESQANSYQYIALYNQSVAGMQFGSNDGFTFDTSKAASVTTSFNVNTSSVAFRSSASVTLPSKTFFPEEYLTVSSSVTLNSTTHRYATLEMTATSGTSVITVPADASDNFAVGSVIQIIRVGAGEVQVTASAGVTVNNALGSRLRAQWSTATLRKRAANTWLLSGDLKV